jgi:hypothetical protein
MTILKRYVPWLVLVMLLSVVAVLMINKHSGTLKQDIRDFIPAKTTLVDRMTITKQDRQISLRKTGNRWVLQSGLEARPEVVDFFFSSLQRIEMISPASKADRMALVEFLKKEGRIVTLYHNNHRLREFYVGYYAHVVPGTYMMDIKHNIPYRIAINGFDQPDIEDLFSVKEETWQKNNGKEIQKKQ